MPKQKSKYQSKSIAVGANGQLVTKESCKDAGDNLSYGKVVKILGGRNVAVYCSSTNREHQCVIRGNMHNKRSQMIVADDIVLVSLRNFESKVTGDIILKYTHEETRQLERVDLDVVSLTSGKKSSVGVEFVEEVDFEDI